MRTVMMEVDLRAKNMLAVVAAMIRMTRRDPARDAFVETIQGRVEALAAAHSAIVENKWDGAKVSEVVKKTLAPFAGAQQVGLHGADAFISPVVVQALGIVLHELATNAVKHCALSREGGRVRIELQRIENGDLEIAWKERGGPPPAPPERTSFGMRLIKTYIPNQLEGRTELDWTGEGLAARLAIPAGYVI